MLPLREKSVAPAVASAYPRPGRSGARARRAVAFRARASLDHPHKLEAPVAQRPEREAPAFDVSGGAQHVASQRATADANPCARAADALAVAPAGADGVEHYPQAS